MMIATIVLINTHTEEARPAHETTLNARNGVLWPNPRMCGGKDARLIDLAGSLIEKAFEQFPCPKTKDDKPE